MNKLWTDEAWDDYMYQFGEDKKTIKRIHALIKAIDCSPFEGIGKPESLKYNYQGFWSRRIDEVNRLIYKIENDEMYIISCRYYYE